MLLFGLQHEAFDRTLHQWNELDRNVLDRNSRALATGQIQQIAGQTPHACSILLNRGQQLALFGVAFALAEQELNAKTKRRQRCVQLVRQSSYQVGASAIAVAQIGYVLEDENSPERAAIDLPQWDRFQHVGMITAAHVQVNFDAWWIGHLPCWVTKGGTNSEVVGRIA